ncbi:MAG TPA: large conductance mechanosensitive channel protein MscL [Burkholderiaceae bacterium]|nr:large conductance mechanosensitive channel protein MscL [Burkholderiaceae bacterium]
MSMLKEFREFAARGNVVDLAVGVIIGAAFGKIVDSLVKDIIMPVVGAVFGGLDFSNYFFPLAKIPANYNGPMTYEALTKAGVPLFAYGSFITVALNFLILAFVIFLLVRAFNKMRARMSAEAPPPPPAEPPASEVYLKEIRDALVKRA